MSVKKANSFALYFCSRRRLPITRRHSSCLPSPSSILSLLPCRGASDSLGHQRFTGRPEPADLQYGHCNPTVAIAHHSPFFFFFLGSSHLPITSFQLPFFSSISESFVQSSFSRFEADTGLYSIQVARKVEIRRRRIAAAHRKGRTHLVSFLSLFPRHHRRHRTVPPPLSLAPWSLHKTPPLFSL